MMKMIMQRNCRNLYR